MKKLYGYADEASSRDLLGAERYFDGLAGFIGQCQTPMTIAIQGDWGSGKTTALKIIGDKLEKSSGTGEGKRYILWFRTWQYAQFDLSEHLSFSLMSAFYHKLREICQLKQSKALHRFSGITRNLLLTILDGSLGGKASEMSGRVLDLLAGTEEQPEIFAQIEELREIIQETLDEALGEHDRLVVFVDDLDRLVPKTAVELLEILKNFFDCRKCVFVLAVDDAVVKQGVEEKYGKSIGEQKKQKFFDKIIQVPFNLPVSQYNLRSYVGQFLEDEKMSEEEIMSYVRAAESLVGYNPRAIKRAFNLYELHKLIVEDGVTKGRGFRLYVLVLLQIYKPGLYRKMVEKAKESSAALKKLFLEDEEEIQGIRQICQLQSSPTDTELDELVGLLVHTARISNLENTAAAKKKTIQLSGDKRLMVSFPSLEAILLAFSEEQYELECINKERMDIILRKNHKKCAMLKKSNSGEKVNMTVYQLPDFDITPPQLPGLTENLEEAQHEVLGYRYTENSYITFLEVDVPEKQKVLLQVLKCYGFIV